MKDGMNTRSSWKLEFICHFANLFLNLVGIVKAACQFLICSCKDCLLVVGMKFKENPIALLEIHISSFRISKLLHMIISCTKIGFELV